MSERLFLTLGGSWGSHLDHHNNNTLAKKLTLIEGMPAAAARIESPVPVEKRNNIQGIWMRVIDTQNMHKGVDVGDSRLKVECIRRTLSTSLNLQTVDGNDETARKSGDCTY